MAQLDPAAIERLRENSHIRLDRDGRFWHEGGLVEHARVAEAFHRGLGRAPDGRATLKVGHTWCYIQVEDTLYLVRRALCEAEGERLASCQLWLDDGSEEPLGPDGLAVNADGILYARVKGGQEWARLIPEAQLAVGRFIDAEDGQSPRLKTRQGDWAIGAKG